MDRERVNPSINMLLMNTFDDVFNKYYHVLLKYGLKFISDEDTVEDILQEVFLDVWKKEKHKLQEAHIKSYLFNSVRNGCLNHIRHLDVIKKHNDTEIFNLRMKELTYYQLVEKSLIEIEDMQNIHDAINSLPPVSKEIIALSRFEELRNKEIAEKLNIPLRTVETRIFRALSKLRDIFFISKEKD